MKQLPTVLHVGLLAGGPREKGTVFTFQNNYILRYVQVNTSTT